MNSAKFILGAFLALILLPWYAFIEWATNTQHMDWRGHRRGAASGPMGLVAVISFVIQIAFLIMLVNSLK